MRGELLREGAELRGFAFCGGTKSAYAVEAGSPAQKRAEERGFHTHGAGGAEGTSHTF